MNVVVAFVVLLLLPVSVQLLARRVHVSRELLRKLVHIGGALLTLPLPFVLSYRQIVLLALVFAVLMAVSRRARIFTAVHDVERRTYGEVLFPLGVALLAAAFPDRMLFAYGVLTLGLADGLAALVGTRYGRMRIRGGKSVWGSATFLAVSLVSGMALAGPSYSVLLAAVALTLVEAALRNGFDNLVVPALAALLLSVA